MLTLRSADAASVCYQMPALKSEKGSLGARSISWFGAFYLIKNQRGREAIELRISSLCKKLLEFDRHLPFHLCELYENDDREFLESVDKEEAKALLVSIDNDTAKELSDLNAWLQTYVNYEGSLNFREFLVEVRSCAHLELYQDVLKEFGEKLEAYKHLDAFESFEDKLLCMEAFVRLFFAESFGLEIAKWTPQGDVELLIQALKEYGPLVVQGKWYGCSSITLEGVGISSLLITGAEEWGEASIVHYFDPECGEQGVMAYHTFQKLCTNLTGDEVDDQKAGYALFSRQ